MPSSTSQKSGTASLTHRPKMPSTRRSQASFDDLAQGQKESSASLSPKMTRSGKVLQSQDETEQDSIARGAKRRKTASPPLNSIADHDGPFPIPKEQSQVLKNVQAANGGDDAVPERDYVEDSGGKEQSQEDGAKNDPAVATGTRPKPEPSPDLSSASETTSIPVLEDLADQILDIHIRLTPQELGSAINDSASDTGKTYVQLQLQFGAAKERYGDSRPFLSPTDLGIADPGNVEICRRVNIATFASSLFDGRISLHDLDNHFLFLFVPRGGTLSKLAASLWIELKTQTFITSVVTSDPRPPAAVLSVLFKEDVQQRLLEIRPGAEDLAQSEEDFLRNMRSRREILEAHIDIDTSTLLQQHRWEDFLEEATSYIKILKNDSGALTGSERLLLRPRRNAAREEVGSSSSQSVVPNGPTSTHVPKPSGVPPGYLDTPEESFKHKLARCALLAIQKQGVPYFTVENLPYPLIPYSTQLQEPRWDGHEGEAQRTLDVPTAGNEIVPHSSQTAPTLVLYDRARSAVEKEGLLPPSKTTHGAGEGEPRPWTLEEEALLLKGLDRVQGSQWSEILTDEKLRDRTEAQLKDKARGLKLFFLKAGVEVPFYLKDVTGLPVKKEDEKSPVKAEDNA